MHVGIGLVAPDDLPLDRGVRLEASDLRGGTEQAGERLEVVDREVSERADTRPVVPRRPGRAGVPVHRAGRVHGAGHTVADEPVEHRERRRQLDEGRGGEQQLLPARELHQRTTFVRDRREGLLDDHMLAGLEREAGKWRVGIGRRRDQDQVDIARQDGVVGRDDLGAGSARRELASHLRPAVADGPGLRRARGDERVEAPQIRSRRAPGADHADADRSSPRAPCRHYPIQIWRQL